MTYIKQRDIARKKLRVRRHMEPWRDIVLGLIFSIGGEIEVPNKPDWVWVKEWNTDFSQGQALKGRVTVVEGTPVMMAVDPKNPYQYKIIDIYTGGLNPGSNNTIIKHQIGEHGDNHQWQTEALIGPDPVAIWQPAEMALKTEGNGSSLMITIWGCTYWYGGEPKTFAGAQVALTGFVPGAGLHRYVLTGLNITTGAVTVTAGATIAVASTPPFPVRPANTLPSALVQLTNGQTDVTTVDDVTDARERFGGFNSIGDPTVSGQILIADSSLNPTWGLPLVDEDGNVMTDENSEIMWE